MRTHALVFVLLLMPNVAFAHLELLEPTPRDGRRQLKDGPCGVIDSPRGPSVATFTAGETITIRWDEYIDHPSHYRVSLDPEGDGGFVDPPTMMDFYSNDLVLLDAISDREDGGIYEVELTLPADVACDRCVLQVVQVMYDKPPYEVGGNDIYYQCADIEITATTVPDAGTMDAGADAGRDAGTDAGRDASVEPDAGSDAGELDTGGADASADTASEDAGGATDDGGCTATGGRGTGGAWFVVTLGVAIVRRRLLGA